MLRRTPVSKKYYGWHYMSPMVRIPDEFHQRIANGKEVVLTPKRDPKNKWGLHTAERMNVHPSVWGLDRSNWVNYNNRGGIICDVPPVPVYRSHIWCCGQITWKQHHPRIYIKCPPNFVVSCKWCRIKYLNMSTDDDNDEDWQKEQDEIALKPETMEQLMTPYRRLHGVLGPSNFQDGQAPHPEVYKTVYNPDVFYSKYMPEKACSHQVGEGDKRLDDGHTHDDHTAKDGNTPKDGHVHMADMDQHH
jgi:hypothetical protein